MDIKEIWRDIEGYEGLYQVSNFGRVKSLNYRRTCKEKLLKAYKDKEGYLHVSLCKDGKTKTYSIHRLVAQEFIPNPYNLPQVNHKDENKTNNRVYNLEWCSVKYNINYGTRNKRQSESRTNYTKFSKQVLCVETGVIYPSTSQVEREFGFSKASISRCCLRKQKTCGRFHWRYID